jgi:uncharacterized protein (DUF1810 family)
MSYDLDRFLEAQEHHYEHVLQELRAGRKTTHWMWYIFPQIRGLGHSPTSRFYAIASIEEAMAYLAHPILGLRLRECTQLVLEAKDQSLTDIFGGIDALKFCSCMTLFLQATDDGAIFAEAIDRYCNGREDPATVNLLRQP